MVGLLIACHCRCVLGCVQAIRILVKPRSRLVGLVTRELTEFARVALLLETSLSRSMSYIARLKDGERRKSLSSLVLRNATADLVSAFEMGYFEMLDLWHFF